MIKNVLIFTSGVAAGAIGCWVYAKRHFEELNELDIQAEKEYYRRKIEEFEQSVSEKATADIAKEFDREEAKNLAKSNNEYKEAISKNYGGYFENAENSDEIKPVSYKAKNSIERVTEPYIISGDEYADNVAFDKITLTYYEEDGIFANIEDEIFDGGELAVGRENLEHFGEFEDGVLYVRNEVMGVDYEVIYESGSYSDIVGE